MDKTFDLCLRLLDNGKFEVELYEHESGDYVEISGQHFTGDHSEFDTAIGNEICSWLSLMADEKEERDEMKRKILMRKYKLPNPTTPEDLECIWSNKVLDFGDKVLLAGYYFNGMNKPCYFGAVYEHLNDDLSCEGAIGLKAVSEVEFEDTGHAIAWAMQQ